MVTSTEKPINGDGDAPQVVIPKAEGLPVGNYRVVGWDLDFTGRRLVDEILQIGAFTPDNEFSIYLMPNGDLNLACRRRHKLKVVTIHRYRVLKHARSNKPIKTKSEISGLVDFITWLEEIKGDAKDGIILVFHEAIHSSPALLLHCLGRYPHANLVERFKAVVAGFANGFALAESKCAKSTASFNLKTLSSVLLGKEENLDSAADRARITYQVLQKLCADDGAENNAGAGDSSNVANLISCVREYTQPIRREEELLVEQQEMIKRQDALRPVFIHLMRGNRKDRLRAFSLRRHLVDANVDMASISGAWEAGQKDAVGKLLEEKAKISNEADREELVTQIEWHFMPETRPKPERRPSLPKKGRRHSKSAEKTNGSLEDGPKDPVSSTDVSPDTTTVSLSDKTLDSGTLDIKASP